MTRNKVKQQYSTLLDKYPSLWIDLAANPKAVYSYLVLEKELGSDSFKTYSEDYRCLRENNDLNKFFDEANKDDNLINLLVNAIDNHQKSERNRQTIEREVQQSFEEIFDNKDASYEKLIPEVALKIIDSRKKELKKMYESCEDLYDLYDMYNSVVLDIRYIPVKHFSGKYKIDKFTQFKKDYPKMHYSYTFKHKLRYSYADIAKRQEIIHKEYRHLVGLAFEIICKSLKFKTDIDSKYIDDFRLAFYTKKYSDFIVCLSNIKEDLNNTISKTKYVKAKVSVYKEISTELDENDKLLEEYFNNRGISLKTFFDYFGDRLDEPSLNRLDIVNDLANIKVKLNSEKSEEEITKVHTKTI